MLTEKKKFGSQVSSTFYLQENKYDCKEIFPSMRKSSWQTIVVQSLRFFRLAIETSFRQKMKSSYEDFLDKS